MSSAFREPEPANPSLAKRFIAGCIERGCDHFFVAPGSRCTPLTLAIAENPRAHVIRHFDERGLAFACLGYGRGAGRAGAFVCTSGTAVANAMPAVVEANLDHVPMLLLTADRPPELRDTGANQAIDQVKLFGDHVTWFFDLPCPAPELSVDFWDGTLRYALQRSGAGPVHLNCQFREPFVAASPSSPDATSRVRSPSESVASFSASSPPPSSLPGSAPTNVTYRTRWRVPRGNALVLVGNASQAEVRAAQRLATRLDCPCLCDIATGRRTLAYDLLLMRGHVPPPEVVIHVGERFVSKRLLTYLASNPPRHWIHIARHPSRMDPLHQVTEQLVGEVEALCDGAEAEVQGDRSFVAAWQDASQRCRDLAARQIAELSELSEPGLAVLLPRLLPAPAGLLLGNSMPVRDFETFAWWDAAAEIRVAVNRGASGIDGLLATAVGFARGIGHATTAVVGDLSALHDLNSLALVAQSSIPLIVVVVNNDGGGIFHFLPIAEQTEHFESYFGTPHGYRFEHAAAMFGLRYERPQSIGEFETAYGRVRDEGVSALLEVMTDRTENVRLHRRLAKRLQGAES